MSHFHLFFDILQSCLMHIYIRFIFLFKPKGIYSKLSYALIRLIFLIKLNRIYFPHFNRLSEISFIHGCSLMRPFQFFYCRTLKKIVEPFSLRKMVQFKSDLLKFRAQNCAKVSHLNWVWIESHHLGKKNSIRFHLKKM